MCSLQCFIAIIKCNLYIKIRKIVRDIHLWGIVNIAMTSLKTTQDTAKETTAGLEQPFEICFWSVQVCFLAQEDNSISLVTTVFPYETFKGTWRDRTPSREKQMFKPPHPPKLLKYVHPFKRMDKFFLASPVQLWSGSLASRAEKPSSLFANAVWLKVINLFLTPGKNLISAAFIWN